MVPKFCSYKPGIPCDLGPAEDSKAALEVERQIAWKIQAREIALFDAEKTWKMVI